MIVDHLMFLRERVMNDDQGHKRDDVHEAG